MMTMNILRAFVWYDQMRQWPRYDVETDLFVDPRTMEDAFWQDAVDVDIVQAYGEGWYGQRPVPSLGGGPG
ncbi:MAG: hypothetical protein SGARI_007300 [Bacillariaceae sp.]